MPFDEFGVNAGNLDLAQIQPLSATLLDPCGCREQFRPLFADCERFERLFACPLGNADICRLADKSIEVLDLGPDAEEHPHGGVTLHPGAPRQLVSSDKATANLTAFQSDRFARTAGTFPPCGPCLLYTSDAADDLTRVDLGGR